MKRVKRNSELWQYLNLVGVLDKGSDDEIKQAKREYRAQYLKRYKGNRRGVLKGFSFTCNKVEATRLIAEAKKHGLKPSRFLKVAVFAYMSQGFVVPQSWTLYHIEQILLTCKTTIERIAEREQGAWFKQDRNYAELERAILTTHDQLIKLFAHPPNLELVIGQTLKEKPEYLEILKELIASYDSQKPFTADSVIRPAT